ncbi:MAG: PEP-CTERM sorting domain-containing protein [Tepidisphaeraceae bacterium]
MSSKMQGGPIHSCAFVLVAAVGLAVGASQANAALLTTSIVNDTFDTYTSQSNFEAMWVPIGTGTPSGAVWSSTQSASSPQSVQVPGNTTATASLTQSRNRATFAETSTVGTISPATWITFSVDFYDVGRTASTSPMRNYANLQDGTAPSGTNQLVSLGLNNNQISTDSGGNYFMARILGYSPPAADPDGGPGETGTLGSGAYFKLNDTGVGLRNAAAGWRNLKVVIGTNDGASTDYLFYVDGVLAETVSNVGSAASIRSYENIVIGSGLSNGNIGAYFDNVSLTVTTPEPATLIASGALAAFALIRRR